MLFISPTTIHRYQDKLKHKNTYYHALCQKKNLSIDLNFRYIDQEYGLSGIKKSLRYMMSRISTSITPSTHIIVSVDRTTKKVDRTIYVIVNGVRMSWADYIELIHS